MRKVVAMIALLNLIVGVNSASSPSPARNRAQQMGRKYARFPASRGTTTPGELWLTWLTPVRVWFVEAALTGYTVGYDEGCSDAIAAMRGLPATGRQASEDVCPNRGKFRNNAMHYAEQMTEFYKRYPEDRDLPLAYLTRMLLGRKPKTLDEIHQWVNSIGH
ncbi:MAG: hypothetical protein ACLQOO_33860 [Terriglobia bacterium]